MVEIEIKDEHLAALFEEKLRELWPRALEMFHQYGPRFTRDIATVLFYAADWEKTERVLKMLEEHYESVLKFQPVELRGALKDSKYRVNRTEQLFASIHRNVLHLFVVPGV